MSTEAASSRPCKKAGESLAGSTRKRRPSDGEEGGGSLEAEDAITEEEIAGTAEPAPAHASKPRNAFTELMAPKPKPDPKTRSSAVDKPKKAFRDRDALGAYLVDPASLPSSLVVFYDDDFVALHDRYPKASVHCLLLPRSPKYNAQHPFEAFEDTAFLASVKSAAARLKTIVAKELQRQFGPCSAQDAKREAVLNGDSEPDVPGELPAGRDWEAEVKVGVHSRPSMNHLHVHVFSRDMHSERMKHKKHYNSFTTRFLVPLEDFPLAHDDWRRHPHGWQDVDMKCWRCGSNFGNKFKALKEHLDEEFEQWKQE